MTLENVLDQMADETPDVLLSDDGENWKPGVLVGYLSPDWRERKVAIDAAGNVCAVDADGNIIPEDIILTRVK